MKTLTKRIHNIVALLGLDGLLAHQSKNLPFFRNFVPTNKEYDKSNIVQIRRVGVRFILNLSDYMQWHVFANMPEPLWVYSWKSLKQDSVIIDIGANIGAFSLKTARMLMQQSIDFTIFAFEPNPVIVNQFKKNLNLNPDLISNIKIVPLALSDQNGKMYFESDTENSGTGKLSDIPTKCKVEVSTLDKFVANSKLDKIDLIKIDVEGHEPLTLRGAKNSIEKYKPILILEITDEWFKAHQSSAFEIIHDLVNLGYKLFSDITGKVTPFCFNDSQELPYQYNILAICDLN